MNSKHKIGNQNTHNFVSVGGAFDLGEIETEIVNICKKLDIKRKKDIVSPFSKEFVGKISGDTQKQNFMRKP